MAAKTSEAKPRKVNKSAVTGRFVSDKEVKRHPKTTFKQTVKATRGGKKK